ncbi:MAG: GNAT family N-acetyltransferase [Planctomycetota bacterium]
MKLQKLGEEQRTQLAQFLEQRPDTTMFLRANLQRGGIEYHGQTLQAEYWGLFDASGELVGVTAHAWNGSLLLDGRDQTATLLAQLAPHLNRPIQGLTGVWDEVVTARAVLGLNDRATTLESCEDLMSLPLEQLRLPESLRRGDVCYRRSQDDDVPLLQRWRSAYAVETLGAEAGPETDQKSAEGVLRAHHQNDLWVLESEGELVAMTAFNARLDDCVQVGGVFTPKDLRCQGYGRGVVAGSLQDVHAEGVGRALLFTENPWARRAYEALGFEVVGDYGLVFFATE